MSITDKRLTVIQARVEEATDGPWFVEYESEECPPFKPYAYAIHGPTMQGVLESQVSDDFKAQYGHQMDEVVGVAAADAEFIAHAREDIPALLAEIYRLKNRVGVLQSENHRLSEALTTSRHREAAARLLPAKMDW